MVSADRVAAVKQRVEQGDADDVRFRAGGDVAPESVVAFAQPRVVPGPCLARVLSEADPFGGAPETQREAQLPDDVGEVDGVDVATERQRLGGPNGEVEEAVEEAVGDFGGVDVARELVTGDV